MAISRGTAEPRSGRVDRRKVLGTTEAEIDRQIEEDGGWELGPPDEVTVTTPPEYVRALREKYGLTQGEFAVNCLESSLGARALPTSSRRYTGRKVWGVGDEQHADA